MTKSILKRTTASVDCGTTSSGLTCVAAVPEGKRREWKKIFEK